jgi:hypothetical protein
METAPGHPAVCAALRGVCRGKETRAVSVRTGGELRPRNSQRVSLVLDYEIYVDEDYVRQ